MTYEQLASVGLLALALGLFVWGRLRYDIVALAALLAGVVLGVVPAAEAFNGFGHPAVITVAAVLILSRGLAESGATAIVAEKLQPLFRVQVAHIASLSGVAAALSGFMNNVGALALLMPVAIRSAADAKRSPSLLLMPLAFGSILGGLVTLIGTPPNIIVATYRQQATGSAFLMFDFAPVGVVVASAGLLFVAIVGWRLIPLRRPADGAAADAFGMEGYLAEARIKEGSPAIGKTVRALDPIIGERDAKVVGMIRGERVFPAAPRYATLSEGDVLLIEAEPTVLKETVEALGLEIQDPSAPMAGLLESDDVALVEALVGVGSRLENRTVMAARLQRRHGVNLLAVSRQGRPYRGRLRNFRFEAGDVLLLQGDAERLDDVVSALGCLPLASRGLAGFGGRRSGPLAATALFAGAIAVAAAGLLPIAVALSLAALGMVLTGVLHARQLYESVDWSVIVLLGALIPLGAALETSGATGLAAGQLAALATDLPPWLTLTVILVVTMTVSDVLNNAATAVVMAPLAYSVANALGVNPDAYLMAVAVGASCAFLTPIGHQNNTLVMGPGGYRFGDYWRMGLPLEAIICAVAVPTIMAVWPLQG